MSARLDRIEASSATATASARNCRRSLPSPRSCCSGSKGPRPQSIGRRPAGVDLGGGGIRCRHRYRARRRRPTGVVARRPKLVHHRHRARPRSRLPGVLTARVTPGATALDVQAKHAAAQQESGRSAGSGRRCRPRRGTTCDQRRRELHSSRDQLSATLEGLSATRGGPTARPAGSVAGRRPQTADVTIDRHRAVPNSTRPRRRAAAEPNAGPRRRAAAAADAQADRDIPRATVLQNKSASQRDELDRATEQLTQERRRSPRTNWRRRPRPGAKAGKRRAAGPPSWPTSGRRGDRTRWPPNWPKPPRRPSHCATATKTAPGRYAKSASNSRSSAVRAAKATRRRGDRARARAGRARPGAVAGPAPPNCCGR